MKSYKFARRSFLTAVGGAFGLHTLLRNMEAAAQGEGAPPRFLMISWPCGTVKYPFTPMGTGTAYTASTTRGQPGHIISPFATPTLKPHVHILTGLNMQGLTCPGGGAHEAGTPFATTGASGPGTRRNAGETDDGCAGGPSWDQILLEHAEGLKGSGRGYYNVICDARVDSYETSTRCLSYGYMKQSIASNQGGMISENTPLRPTLKPITAYTDLFGDFMPGGGGMTDMDALRLLKQRKSVLDHSKRALDRLHQLAPANERVKIDAHAEIIRKAKTDRRIARLLIKPDMADSPYWAKLQEIRDAIVDFKQSGKPVYAFLETASDQQYYLASAADTIYLLPTSTLDLTGLASYEVFLRGTFDWIASDLCVQDPDGRVLARDRYRLDGTLLARSVPGVTGPLQCQGAFVVVQRQVPQAALVEALRAALPAGQGLYAGASSLPADCGAWVRVLAADALLLRDALQRAWYSARRLITGAQPQPRRK